jgi:catechol 2,3-dioxygenase-like lactoylglutathione lyase family enzyme
MVLARFTRRVRMAQRAGAHTVEVPASYLCPGLGQPGERQAVPQVHGDRRVPRVPRALALHAGTGRLGGRRRLRRGLDEEPDSELTHAAPGWGRIGTMIGRLHHVVIDCPDPAALAEFYSEVIGLPVTYRSADFVVIARNDTTSGVAFQLAPGHQPPRWPDPDRPQQFHFDVMVDDLDAAEPQVLALGARRLPSADGRVYADPAGHPFCLIPRPSWAEPIGG